MKKGLQKEACFIAFWNKKKVTVLGREICQIRGRMAFLAPVGRTTSFCIWPTRPNCSVLTHHVGACCTILSEGFQCTPSVVTNLMIAASIIKSHPLFFHESSSLEMVVHECQRKVMDLPRTIWTGPTNYNAGWGSEY